MGEAPGVVGSAEITRGTLASLREASTKSERVEMTLTFLQ